MCAKWDKQGCMVTHRFDPSEFFSWNRYGVTLKPKQITKEKAQQTKAILIKMILGDSQKWGSRKPTRNLERLNSKCLEFQFQK